MLMAIRTICLTETFCSCRWEFASGRRSDLIGYAIQVTGGARGGKSESYKRCDADRKQNIPNTEIALAEGSCGRTRQGSLPIDHFGGIRCQEELI